MIIQASLDLYASSKTFTIVLIFPVSVNPTKTSGEINLTKGKLHFYAISAATDVFPDPEAPSSKIEFNYEFFPFFVYSTHFNETFYN